MLRRALSTTAPPVGTTLLYKAGDVHQKRIFKQTALGASSLAVFTIMKMIEIDSPQDFMFWSSVPMVGGALSALFLGMNKLSTRDSVSEMYGNSKEGTFTIRTFTMLGKVREGDDIKVASKGLAFHGFGHKPNYFFVRLQDPKRIAKQRILRLEKNETTEKIFNVNKQQQPVALAGRKIKK